MPRQCTWKQRSEFADNICPGPVDDETWTFGNPWTFTPCCRNLNSIGKDEKYCVYSLSTFNDNSGISLITTPATAASLVEAIENSTAALDARHHIARHGKSQSRPGQGRRKDDPRVPYEVAFFPGKGMGVVATRKIEQFETIMTSYPAMIIDNEFFPALDQIEELSPSEGPRLFQTALDQLTDKERFVSLATSRGGDVHIVEDVVRTNAFGVHLSGEGYKGLYPEIARMNHNCDPNAFARFTRRALALDAVATRDILPGEEITISYIGLGMPTKYRTRALENWGFNCTCPKCNAAPAEMAESDHRLELLLKLSHAIQDEESNYHYDDIVRFTKEFVSIVKEEKLTAKVGEYYQLFMKVFYDYGDTDSALKYGRTALAYAEAFADPEAGFCTGIRRDLEYLGETTAV